LVGIALVLTGTALGAPTPATAESAKRAFDIPAETAETALRSFAEQADTQFVYSADKVEGVRTNALRGNYAPREALDRLVSGTELFVVQDVRTGALTVDRNRPGAIPQNSPTPQNEAKMKTHIQTHNSLLSWLAALFVATSSASVSAQEATAQSTSTASSQAIAEQTIVLPEFAVRSTKVSEYGAEEAASIARIASSIIDSPMTVNVIPPAMLQDLGTTVLLDDVTYFAGMSTGRGSGPGAIQDRMTFRGFDTSGGKMVDDFPQFLQPTGVGPHGNFDPVLIDRAELVMGPDTILSPTGTPGGSMNVFTKSPLFEAGTDISMQYGNYFAGGVSVDTTGPLGDGKHWAYRIIGDYQEYRAFMPGSVKMATAAAELTYKFSDTVKVTAKYISEACLPTGEVSMVGEQGEEVYGPNSVGGATLPDTPTPGFTYGGWNGVPTWVHQYDRVNILEAELTAALSPRVNMRLAAQGLWCEFTADNCFPSANPAETWDPVTGVETSVTPLNPAALVETANYNHDMSRDIQVQNDFAGNFNVGGVSLKPLLGWEYEQFETTQWQIQDKNMPTADILGQSDGPGYTPYNPVHPPYSAYTSFSANFPENGWFGQVYGLIRAGMLNDRLLLTGSYSRTWADVNDYHFTGIYLPGIGQVGSTAAPTLNTFGKTGVAVAPSVNPYRNEYLAGILGKPLPNVSIYYSFSTNAAIAGNTPLWQTGKQHEFGIKTDFFNHRLSVSADHFQITETNITVTNPLFNTGQSTIANILANETNHGEELNVSGGITRNLSVIMSYTNMKLRDVANRQIRNIPDNMANLLLNYHFSQGSLKGASVFLGVQHMGKVAGENAPNLGYTPLGVPDQIGYYVRAWTVANAGASYRWKNYRFNLNVDNVLNQRFWWQPSSRIDVVPYPGLAVRFSVTIHL
jgi:iron complex outermembrane receptor protein